jgi:ABC-type multidrug transport system permease subunit
MLRPGGICPSIVSDLVLELEPLTRRFGPCLFVITEFELRKLRMGSTSSGNATCSIIVVLAATLFSTFSLVIACIVKTRERFLGVGQVLTMPLCFAGNAIHPTTMMPAWLQFISHLNPLTYVVDALRATMPAGSPSTLGIAPDCAVMLATTTLLVLIGARLYPRLAT